MTGGAVGAVHVAAGVAGMAAAGGGLFGSVRRRDRTTLAHVVMVAAMASCLAAALGVGVPVGALLLAAVASWAGAWTVAAADRRGQRRSGLPLDLVATGALMLLLPMGHGAAPPPAGAAHSHSTGASSTVLLALGVAVSWLVASLLRCRPRAPRAAEHGSGLLPSACAAGMAGSMIVMAAVGG